jgi:transcriptional regulator GlxA family with amidase domain
MTRRTVMLAYEQAQSLDVIGPLEVFARASRWLRDHRSLVEPAYDVALVTIEGGPLLMSNGLSIMTARAAGVRSADTLLVTGGIGCHRAAEDQALINWLKDMAPRVRRLGSVCTGSIVLAAAGLLRGHKATTHWAYLDKLQSREPSCNVDRGAIFVRSGNVITSAGVTAGMDMALALVEDDHDRSVAVHVAQELVMYLRRPGDQAQFSRHLAIELKDTPFAALELWVTENLGADLSVRSLAAQAGMSERHFIRRFTAEIGCPPATWVRNLRIEAARRQLEQGAATFKDVARRCGFGDEQSMRRAFQAHLGVTPSDYAARFT